MMPEPPPLRALAELRARLERQLAAGGLPRSSAVEALRRSAAEHRSMIPQGLALEAARITAHVPTWEPPAVWADLFTDDEGNHDDT